MAHVLLPYGRRPLLVELGDRPFTLVGAQAPAGAVAPIRDLLAAALAAPIASPPLEAMVRPGDRVTLVISDPTRAEPRDELVRAVRDRLPEVDLTIAVATGTHGRCQLDDLHMSVAAVAGARVVNHDGHDDTDLVPIGTTRRGTPVRVHRCMVEADVVVATGAIRPHYFAGFGAGIKAVFPGLGGAREIRINHLLKAEPGSEAGVVVGNPCRDDLEDVAQLLGVPIFLVNLVVDPDERPRDAVAGHVILAFRAGAERCRQWFAATAEPAPVVLVSDALPVTASLYQASKLVAAAAGLLAPGGTLIVAAECLEGVTPVDVVNQAIYQLGLVPRLPADHRIVLVSALSAETVGPSYARWAPSCEAVLAELEGPVIVAPKASKLIVTRP